VPNPTDEDPSSTAASPSPAELSEKEAPAASQQAAPQQATSQRSPQQGEPGSASKDAADPPPRRRLMSPYDIALTVLLCVVWLGPVTYVGATQKETPGMPAWLRHQHRISCLFIDEVKGWQSYEMQIQTEADPTWQRLSEKGYFEQTVFGYRTRLHRLLSHSVRRGKGALRISEVARFIRARYVELNPNGPKLLAIRFARIHMTNEMLAKQSGRFKPMRPEQVPKNYTLYFGELRFDGKRATDPGFGRSPKKPSTPVTPAPKR
jgi:hypothetical protein